MASDFKSRIDHALNQWRADRSFRFLVMGILLCVGLTLLLLHQLR